MKADVTFPQPQRFQEPSKYYQMQIRRRNTIALVEIQIISLDQERHPQLLLSVALQGLRAEGVRCLMTRYHLKNSSIDSLVAVVWGDHSVSDPVCLVRDIRLMGLQEVEEVCSMQAHNLSSTSEAALASEYINLAAEDHAEGPQKPMHSQKDPKTP